MIIQFLKWFGKNTAAAAELLWKKLPRIALYSVAFYALFAVGTSLYAAYDKHKVEQQPGTDFITYTSFTVNNIREGDDVSFTLCRTHDRNYGVDGVRTVYVVPDGKKEADKVFVYSKRIAGIVDNENCQSYFIEESEYHFKPGKYLITLDVNFRVKYDLEKKVFTKSNIFNVYPVSSSSDLQSRYNSLQQQLDDQQRLLDSLVEQGVIRSPSTSSSSPQPTPTDVNTSDPSISTDPETPPAAPETKRVCDPVVDLLGIKIGETNCRQEPA